MNVSLRGNPVQMWVSNRVFSSNHLDKGTEQLLYSVPPLPQAGPVLDLGCGWGAISIASALECPEAPIWAVDVNERALALCEQNAKVNKASNVKVLQADEALALAKQQNIAFQTIISNPPVRIGKDALHGLIRSWLPFLAQDGTAWFVMSKNLGADSFMKWLRSEGLTVTKFASRKGFRIIQAHH